MPGTCIRWDLTKLFQDAGMMECRALKYQYVQAPVRQWPASINVGYVWGTSTACRIIESFPPACCITRVGRIMVELMHV